MPSAKITALVDTIEAQALADGKVSALSMASLYRFFLTVYEHDEISTREAFTQFLEGEIPPAVLTYCLRENPQEIAMRPFGKHLHNCDNPWNEAPPWAVELGVMMGLLLNIQEIDNMATKATLDALTANVKANTDATASATLALTGFVKSTADLTKALQDAIANSEASDDPAVKAAADAIAANNASLTAAIPAVAAAVEANT